MTQENLYGDENIKKFDGFQTKNMNCTYGLELYDKNKRKKLYTCIKM